MVVKQLPKNSTLLDPFCGTGTIVYEAQKCGLKGIGVELNFLAADIAKAKINSNPNDNPILEAEKIINKAKSGSSISMPSSALKHFHLDTADQIMRVANLYDKMSDYMKAVFYGTIALSARGCNGYKWTSSTVGKDINPKVYINFYDKLIYKAKKHHYPIKSTGSKIFQHDSRKLSEIIEKDTIDFVFTSPPYFDCLDYTAYYAKIIYEILGVDRLKIKKELIQTYSSYAEDMKKVFTELNRVCKKGATIIFVVGDKKVHSKVVNGGEFFKKICPFKNCKIVEREYTGTSSQIFDKLNGTKRKEQIIIWTK